MSTDLVLVLYSGSIQMTWHRLRIY